MEIPANHMLSCDERVLHFWKWLDLWANQPNAFHYISLLITRLTIEPLLGFGRRYFGQKKIMRSHIIARDLYRILQNCGLKLQCGGIELCTLSAGPDGVYALQALQESPSLTVFAHFPDVVLAGKAKRQKFPLRQHPSHFFHPTDRQKARKHKAVNAIRGSGWLMADPLGKASTGRLMGLPEPAQK